MNPVEIVNGLIRSLAVELLLASLAMAGVAT
jgi:hypothetical protein